MKREGVKRKRSEENEEPVVASINALKSNSEIIATILERSLLNNIDSNPKELPYVIF